MFWRKSMEGVHMCKTGRISSLKFTKQPYFGIVSRSRIMCRNNFQIRKVFVSFFPKTVINTSVWAQISLEFNSHVCLNWHLPPLFETTDIQCTKYLTNLVLLVPNVSYGTWFFPLGFLVEKTWSITYSKRCHWISNNYQKTRDKCISDKEPRQSHPWINFKRLKWRTCNIILPQLSPEWIVWMWLSKQIQL